MNGYVRPHALNYTRAQIFEIQKTNSPNSINSYYIKSRGPGPQYFLTAKKPRPLLDGDLTTTSPQGSTEGQPSAPDPQETLVVNENTSNPTRTLKNYILSIEHKVVNSTPSLLLNQHHQEWEIIPMDNKSYRIVNHDLGKDMMLLPESINNPKILIFKNSATSNLFRWEILSVNPVAPDLQKITLADFDIETPPVYRFWESDKRVTTLRWKDDNDAVTYSVWLVNSDGSDSELKSHIPGNERSYIHKENHNFSGGIPKRCYRVIKKNKWNNSSSSEHECFEASILLPD